MTDKEARNILLGSLHELKITRVDYFKNKCIEGNHDPITFYMALSQICDEWSALITPEDFIEYHNGKETIYKKGTIYWTGLPGVNSIDSTDLMAIMEPLHQFGKLINEQIAKLLPPPPEKSNKSFSWTGTPEQLDALCEGLKGEGLKGAGYIDPGTTPEAFKMIFADELRQYEPIQWRGSNRLLAYLFNQLFIMNFIVKEWQSVIGKNHLFKNKSGKTILPNDLATALSAINDPYKGLNPKGSEQIDEILKTLKG